MISVEKKVIDSSKIEKLYFLCLVALSASIPFTIKLNGILMFVTLAVTLFFFIKSENKIIRFKNTLIIFVALYTMHVIGFLNSENSKPVFFDLEQKIPLLIGPFIFALGPPIERKRIVVVLTSFMVSTFVVCMLSFRNGFFMGFEGGDLYDNLLFIRHPYLGMYCVCCIFFSLECFSTASERWIKIAYSFACLFFVIYLFLLFAKMAILVFLILSFVYLMWKLIEHRRHLLSAIILTSSALILTYFFFVNVKGIEIARKIISFGNFDWDNYDPLLVNSANLRLIKWKCSIEILSENKNWLFGAGTGDTKELLISCYANTLGKDSFFVTEGYNSHNTYLTTWLHLGILPLLFLIFHFFRTLFSYIRNVELTSALFTLTILLSCLTESVFEIQKGIVLYCFFQSLFLFNPGALKAN
jgi:O-antigen ligase